MNTIKLSLIILLTFLYSNLAAGTFLKAKIVFKDGKELDGFIKPINPSDKIITFKENLEGNKVSFDSDLIEKLLIYFTDGTVEYIRLKTYNWNHKKIYSASWLEVIEKGHASLYFAFVDGGMSSSGSIIPGDKYWLCHRPGEEAASVVSHVIGKVNANQTFKLKASEFFSDYPELSEKIRNKTYRYDELIFVVKEYNKWKAVN